jgi:hypothetical protein
MPYELMYGRAGFLWAVLFVNKYVGEGTIPWSVTVSLSFSNLLLLFSQLWSYWTPFRWRKFFQSKLLQLEEICQL